MLDLTVWTRMLRNHWYTPSAGREARAATEDAREAKASIAELQASFDRLSLLSLAMWQLLREKAGITDEELVGKIHELDLQDGVRAGKVQARPRNCSECGRQNNGERDACLYCGGALLAAS